MRIPAPKVLIAVGALLAATTAVAVVLQDTEEPAPIRQLEHARKSGEAAGEAGARIAQNLEAIARHLQAGRTLSSDSDEINNLTSRQRRSLADLVGILEAQLEALRRSRSSLRASSEAAAGIAQLSARQARLVEASLRSLRRLRASVADSTRASARFAELARYGARLAEDSRRRFSEGNP